MTFHIDLPSLNLFQIEIGSIYEEENHMHAHTWLTLTDIESLDSSVKGYLKVSMAVFGPVSFLLPKRKISRTSSESEASILFP